VRTRSGVLWEPGGEKPSATRLAIQERSDRLEALNTTGLSGPVFTCS